MASLGERELAPDLPIRRTRRDPGGLSGRPLFNPPHPGETLREDVLPALGLSVTQAAQQLGVSRVALTRVLHGHAGISVDLARRLEAWLRHADGSGPSAESWLRLQTKYELWQAQQEPLTDVKPAPTLEALEA